MKNYKNIQTNQTDPIKRKNDSIKFSGNSSS